MTVGLPEWANPKLAQKRAKLTSIGKKVGDAWYFTYPTEIRGEEITRFLWSLKVGKDSYRVFESREEIDACGVLHNIETVNAQGQDPNKSARPFRKISNGPRPRHRHW